MTETRGATALPQRDPREVSRTRGGGPAGWLRSAPTRLALFYRQVVTELRKVVWPTREQLLTYTAVVLVFVAVIIAIVSVLDLAFGWLVFRIFG